MASITIRNLDDDVKTRLRAQAAEHHRSMAEEVRLILREAVDRKPSSRSLTEITRSIFGPDNGVDLEVPARANHLSRNALRIKILELQEMTSKVNWDGEGAVPLDQETVKHATQFIDCLPPDLSGPDIDVSPHGMIDFEWTLSRDTMLSVSMCPDGTIAFAFRFPEGKMRSTTVWSKGIPENLMVAFDRLQREHEMAHS